MAVVEGGIVLGTVVVASVVATGGATTVVEGSEQATATSDISTRATTPRMRPGYGRLFSGPWVRADAFFGSGVTVTVTPEPKNRSTVTGRPENGRRKDARRLAPMRITVVTIFPEFFSGPLSVGLVGRAVTDGVAEIELHDLRRHGLGRHRQVDDTPYGGGPGMVMRVEPLDAALAPLEDSHRVLLTPAGKPFDQEMADRLATLDHLTLVCGRYEGIDQRVIDHHIDEEVSVGDVVLAGGETGALMVIEAVLRLLPGAVGNPESTESESFRAGLLEEPVYTKPAEYRGWKVPEVLLSGDHARIAEWRRHQRVTRTRERRPDLWARFVAGDDS